MIIASWVILCRKPPELNRNQKSDSILLISSKNSSESSGSVQIYLNPKSRNPWYMNPHKYESVFKFFILPSAIYFTETAGINITYCRNQNKLFGINMAICDASIQDIGRFPVNMLVCRWSYRISFILHRSALLQNHLSVKYIWFVYVYPTAFKRILSMPNLWEICGSQQTTFQSNFQYL